MESWFKTALNQHYIQKFPYNKFINIKSNGNDSGEGKFGQVSGADFPDTNRKVALKKLKRFNINKFVSEVQFHIGVHSSKNIIRFLGVTKESEEAMPYIMVLEYGDQNNLRMFLQRTPKPEWKEKVKLSLDIAKGLGYLHLLKIAHCDLHSKNIIINQIHPSQREYMAKITDFGSAIDTDKHEEVVRDGDEVEVLGQIPFTDPKLLDDHINYKRDLWSDIYSLGVVFWEITTCRNPFDNYMGNSRGYIRDLCLTMEIIGGMRELKAPYVPEKFVKIYEHCWDSEPSNRPEIKEVIERLSNVDAGLAISLSQTSTIGQ